MLGAIDYSTGLAGVGIKIRERVQVPLAIKLLPLFCCSVVHFESWRLKNLGAAVL
jgi:hypothetical protein